MILALISGIAVSALQRTPLFTSLQNIAADLQLACASMRQTASYQNQSICAVFNPETRIISCDGEEIEIPDGIKIFLGEEDITEGAEKKEIFHASNPDEQQEKTSRISGGCSAVYSASLLPVFPTARSSARDGCAGSLGTELYALPPPSRRCRNVLLQGTGRETPLHAGETAEGAEGNRHAGLVHPFSSEIERCGGGGRFRRRSGIPAGPIRSVFLEPNSSLLSLYPCFSVPGAGTGRVRARMKTRFDRQCKGLKNEKIPSCSACAADCGHGDPIASDFRDRAE